MENSVVKFSGFIALNNDVIVFAGEDKKTVEDFIKNNANRKLVLAYAQLDGKITKLTESKPA